MFIGNTTTTVTLYMFYQDPANPANRQIMERAVLDGAFWEEDTAAQMRDTGLMLPRNVTILIPASREVTGREFILPDDWLRLPADEIGNYWTLDRRRIQFTRIIKGEFDAVFEWSNAHGLSVQLNSLITSPLGRTVDALQPFQVDPKLFGTKSLQFVEVMAR